MEFNDEQLPSESSICNMQNSYAQNVSTLSTTSEIDEILNKIDWQSNTQILLNLANRASNTSIRNYILGLIELNQADETQLNNTFKLTPTRRNPPISLNKSFNQQFKAYVTNETNLLTKLISILLFSNKNESEIVVSIINRRLEALSMLANFQTNGIFL